MILFRAHVSGAYAERVLYDVNIGSHPDSLQISNRYSLYRSRGWGYSSSPA
jgi:hypothetical protein